MPETWSVHSEDPNLNIVCMAFNALRSLTSLWLHSKFNYSSYALFKYNLYSEAWRKWPSLDCPHTFNFYLKALRSLVSKTLKENESPKKKKKIDLDELLNTVKV